MTHDCGANLHCTVLVQVYTVSGWRLGNNTNALLSTPGKACIRAVPAQLPVLRMLQDVSADTLHSCPATVAMLALHHNHCSPAPPPN